MAIVSRAGADKGCLISQRSCFILPYASLALDVVLNSKKIRQRSPYDLQRLKRSETKQPGNSKTTNTEFVMLFFHISADSDRQLCVSPRIWHAAKLLHAVCSPATFLPKRTRATSPHQNCRLTKEDSNTCLDEPYPLKSMFSIRVHQFL